MIEKPSKCRWCESLPEIAKILIDSNTWFYVQCTKCDIRTNYRTSAERAVIEWNDQTNIYGEHKE